MDYIFIIIAGLFLLIHTLLKPDYFWEHRKAVLLRNLIGDKITTIIYLIIGVALTVSGVVLGILT